MTKLNFQTFGIGVFFGVTRITSEKICQVWFGYLKLLVVSILESNFLKFGSFFGRKYRNGNIFEIDENEI